MLERVVGKADQPEIFGGRQLHPYAPADGAAVPEDRNVENGPEKCAKALAILGGDQAAFVGVIGTGASTAKRGSVIWSRSQKPVAL